MNLASVEKFTHNSRGERVTFRTFEREMVRINQSRIKAQFPMIRMIRLGQTGVNSRGYHFLILKSIEFFGQLIFPAQ
jgi:hypothetical protein